MKKKFTVLGIGEILWDMLPDGKLLGGAPANFAYHANELGAKGIPVSAIGDDDLGTEIILELQQRGIDISSIQKTTGKNTGTVEVKFVNGEPEYNIIEDVAWDNLKVTDDLKELVKAADVVCYGTLAFRTENNSQVINKLLKNVKSSCVKYFDLNLRQNYYSSDLVETLIKQSTVFKLNENEFDYISKIYSLKGDNIDRCRILIDKYNLDLVVVTLGAEGSILVNKNEFSKLKPEVVKLKDTIGAGDSFSAAIVIGMLNELDINTLNEFANEVSSFVCSQNGGTPRLPERLKNWIKNKREG